MATPMHNFAKQILAVCVLLTAASCQSGNSAEVDLTLSQTPSTVQAAFTQRYQGVVIQQVTRSTRGNQDYYTFKFTGNDGKDRTVQMNEAGDEIENH
jgi:hypothetical protein